MIYIYHHFLLNLKHLNYYLILKILINLKLILNYLSNFIYCTNQLYINNKLINIAIWNILLSWFIFSSYAPKPSVSIKYVGNYDALFLFVIMRGLDQSYIPLVQGFMVGPTL